MNIYNEALERAKEIYEEYYCPVGIIENALECAKKEHELLELYREFSIIYINSECKNRIEVMYKIKEKEKELDELK